MHPPTLPETELRHRAEILGESLTRLERELGVSLCIKDFTGYLRAHPLLGEITYAHFYHNNPYCLEIKRDPELFARCILASKRLMVARFGRSESEGRSEYFFGVCWCGVGEYVFPIRHSGVVIGALLAGEFRAPEAHVERCFARLRVNYGIATDGLRELYDGSLTPHGATEDAVAADEPSEGSCVAEGARGALVSRGLLIASTLSMLAESCVDSSLVIAWRDRDRHSGERFGLMYRVAEYISENYRERLGVRDIAAHCMCSVSALSHTFSGLMGQTIPEFVTNRRINHAKYLLTSSDMTAEQVAYECGFGSATYFSTVFKRLTGTTPAKYRISGGSEELAEGES